MCPENPPPNDYAEHDDYAEYESDTYYRLYCLYQACRTCCNIVSILCSTCCCRTGAQADLRRSSSYSSISSTESTSHWPTRLPKRSSSEPLTGSQAQHSGSQGY